MMQTLFVKERDANWSDQETNMLLDLLEDLQSRRQDLNRYKKYVNKTFPWYNRVDTLYGKSIASGSSNITTAPNCSIPRTFGEVSSSDDNIDTPQQEMDDFSNNEFHMMADGIDLTQEPIYESVDMTTNVPISDSVDPGTNVPNSEPIHEPSSLNRKRVKNSTYQSSRRTKLKKSVNRMDEFAERFLSQQQQRTELIAQMGQANRAHDQVFNKLQSLALPTAIHVDMEMSLGNSWIRECFMKEDDNERLMLLLDRAIGLFRSGQLPLNL